MNGAERKPRQIPWLAGGPDAALVRSNNAFHILDEFTSSRRVATLARIPTQAEVLGAIDTYRSLLTERDGAIVAVLDRLRPLFEAWRPCAEVPLEIQRLVREINTVMEGLEPPAGWDAYDGYPETWGRETASPGGPGAARSPSPGAATGMERVMTSVGAVMGGVNLAALLASPRAWAKVSPVRPSREHILGYLDGYLTTLERETRTEATKPSSFQSTGAPAQQLRTLCETWDPGSELPPEISEAARAVLTAFGLPEPPDGGWDTFEGLPDDLEEPR